MAHLARMRRSPLVVGIFVVGAIATMVASSTAERRTAGYAEAWLAERAEVVQNATVTVVDELVAGIEAVAAFVETADNVNQETFATFVSKLDPRLNKIGIAYLPIVPAAERDAFTAEMRKEIPDFSINELDPFTGEAVRLDSEVETHYPVQLFAPGTFLEQQLPVGDLPLEIGIGVDAASNTTWAQAVEAAVDTNASSVSNFIPIAYQEVSFGEAFIVMTPVHDDTTGEPIGAVGAAMINWLLPTDLTVSITQEIDWSIGVIAEPAPLVDPTEGWIGTIELSGTTWQLEVTATDTALRTLAGTPQWLVWAIGLLLTTGVADLAHLLRVRVRSRSRLSEMQRLYDEKDRFLAAVSHEIRTPLTAVAGLAHELAERPNDFAREEFETLLGTVAEQSDEVGAIVEDLLVAARSDIDSVTVHHGVIDVTHEVGLAIESSGVNATVSTANPPAAWADAQRVRQVLRNLLTNAGRYGGDEIEVRFDADEATVSIIVADSGDPIPAEQQQRIFDPYTSAHTSQEQLGSIGLGLFISRKLASIMQGRLEYQHDGRWSIFTFTIPRSIPVSPRTPSHPPATEASDSAAPSTMSERRSA